MHRPTRTHTMDLLLNASAVAVGASASDENVPPYCYLSQRSCDLYNAVVASAKNSKSIHKQGLACESAGFTMKDGRCTNALVYFQQAHVCYISGAFNSIGTGDLQNNAKDRYVGRRFVLRHMFATTHVLT